MLEKKNYNNNIIILYFNENDDSSVELTRLQYIIKQNDSRSNL